MSWHTLVMAASEFIEFRRDLECKYRREIATGRVAGYALFARKRMAGDHFLFVPPGAVVLFERMPRWQQRLRPYEGTPDLRGFVAVPMR
jgi:hypothetical protein